ncbi:UDP-N-acetylmuramate dehydrogenase [uncultured Oscillibacter sp.]|uniref:UDP-N-acetylmuramate dehydrogenase n=1 Tax=uncultured Oscillibacter sp. TaxID=876091 RepID=UPI0025DCE848|nr:UDP-N-acetylmuramate dehydrogenase [uncultured Oscillibacter sp.]
MDWYTQLDETIQTHLPDLVWLCDEPMSRHTSFRIGGPARRMACPKNGEQLVLLWSFAESLGLRPLVIGNGTNLLAPDGGLDRLVIDTSAAMTRLEAGEDPCVLTAEAGVSLARLADAACKQGLTGLEFAHGIPGTVGGAVCMNAGAYGGEMAQVVERVDALFPGEGVRSLTREELGFAYRCSLFTDRPEVTVLRASFRLTPGDGEAVRRRMRELLERRKQSQPLEWPSAGSTFKRPQGYFAGTLIDQCGLKGLTVGGAQVSEKHAGFVINRFDATSADVEALIREIQDRVLEKTGVRLEPEVRILRREGGA